VTRTPLSRLKGQRSTCSGEGILWRYPAQLVGINFFNTPYRPWEPTATLRSAGAVGLAARGASVHIEGGEGRGHNVAAARLQLVSNLNAQVM